ncbi:MAG: hypothetical protein P0Y53_00555 [Candidatus Pseudobacter hemicellulosilyticus]|uniref:Uncharacterized protein n=1 Tax=Candidatus Pseudobacter hemicellulosilyticus TaxID=3121375 RepID=A0AAJ6BFS5_9BACT|nr:MAG: hypothetical protein P0Y53_00555 [Pseudobacter sp.]
MRLFLLPVFLLTAFSALAQSDSYPDNRNKREAYTRMAEKDLKNDLAAFAFAALDDRLNKQPLQSIPAVDFGANFITFEYDSFSVTIKGGVFRPSEHKLQYFDEKYLVKIDNKPFYGSYGSVPQSNIASVTVLIGKDTIAIPQTAIFDLYSPEFTYSGANGSTRTNNGVYLSPDKRTLYIYMLNHETIGKYEVTWIIQDKKYLRRVVDSGLLH